jgi:hypothetical protein
MAKQDILPTRIRLVGWIEHYDLRLLRRDALKLGVEHRLGYGDALLVSGSRYSGGRRFQFIVRGRQGYYTMAPQTSGQDMMLSLAMRVAAYIREEWPSDGED